MDEMADNVLLAFHIQSFKSKSGEVQTRLNTDKIYQWRITNKTKGIPAIGKVAIVETAFSKTAPVLVIKTKTTTDDISDFKPVVAFTDRVAKEADINESFVTAIKSLNI